MNSTDIIPSVPDFNGTAIISNVLFDSADVISLFCLTIGLLGFPSNAFALFILMQKQANRNQFTSIIILSAIGAIVCAVDVPLNFGFILLKVHPHGGPVLCVLREMARFLLDPLLFSTTCFIAVERYKKIGLLNPPAIPRKVVLCICLSPFLVTVPLVTFLLVTAIGDQSNKQFALQLCNNTSTMITGGWLQIHQYIIPCLFLLTLSIMTVLYILIIFSLKQITIARTSRCERLAQSGGVSVRSGLERGNSTMTRIINRARVSPEPIFIDGTNTVESTAAVAEQNTYPNSIRDDDRNMSTKKNRKSKDDLTRRYSRKFHNTNKFKSNRSQRVVFAESSFKENDSGRNYSDSSGITRRVPSSSFCWDSANVIDTCETGAAGETFETRVEKFDMNEIGESNACMVDNEATASAALQCASNTDPPTIKNPSDVSNRTSQPRNWNRRKTQLHRPKTTSVPEIISREAFHHYFNFSLSNDIILRSAKRRCIVLVLQFGAFFLPTCFISNLMINFSIYTEVSYQAAIISDSIKYIYYAIMPILYVFTNTVLLKLVYADLRKQKILN